MKNLYYVAKCIDDITIQLTEPLPASLAHAAAEHLTDSPQRNTLEGEYMAVNAEWGPTRKEVHPLSVLCGVDFIERAL